MGLIFVQRLIDMMPKWLLLGLLAVALAVGCTERLVISHVKVQLADAKTDLSNQKAAWEKATREASEAARKTEQTWAKRMEDTNEIVAQERSKTADAVRDGDVARSMLLAATGQYTAPSDPRDPGALGRAEARAAALGLLLGKCDQVAADLGRNAEDLATQVRGLQQSYYTLRPPAATHSPMAITFTHMLAPSGVE